MLDLIGRAFSIRAQGAFVSEPVLGPSDRRAAPSPRLGFSRQGKYETPKAGARPGNDAPDTALQERRPARKTADAEAADARRRKNGLCV
jgi:hypothetical protein